MVKVKASKLRDMEIITDTGIRLGWLYDLSFDEDTGEILVIVAEPDENFTDHEGLLLIPMKAVKSLGEFIVVDHNKLAVKSKLRRISIIKEKLQGS